MALLFGKISFPLPSLFIGNEHSKFLVELEQTQQMKTLELVLESEFEPSTPPSTPPSSQAFAYLKGFPNPCPAFLLTIKLPGMKPFTLCALLDSGANCNLA